MMEKLGKESVFVTRILAIYVLAVGIGVPIVVRDGYFDILVVKYYYYCFCTIFMFALLLVYAFAIDRRNTFLNLKKFTVKALLNKLSVIDYAAIIFAVVAIISTVSSDYFYESFWGNEGRYTGLFLISWYVISYFCITRFWKFKNWYIDLILAAGILVCLFGITDYFMLDIFRFKVRVLETEKAIFTSTLGNINTYTAYVGIIVALATVLYALCEKTTYAVFYYFCMIISFFAIAMGASDNAYLSLGALFGFLPLYLFNRKKGIQRYLIILATFFTVIKMIDWINVLFGSAVLGIDGVFKVIIDSGLLNYILIGLWGGVIVWHLLDFKTNSEDKEYGNVFRYIWLGLIACIVLAVLYVLYDCNIAGHVERYGELRGYILFDDEWGTHRGYIWRNAMECYAKFSSWKKIIGAGPETFGILVLYQTKNNIYNQLFDNAHNEYLHLLITMGIAGLSSYLVFVLSCIKRCFSYKKKNHYIIAIAFGVICYSIQATVNINLPIVTPIFWLLLGMGAAESHQN